MARQPDHARARLRREAQAVPALASFREEAGLFYGQQGMPVQPVAGSVHVHNCLPSYEHVHIVPLQSALQVLPWLSVHCSWHTGRAPPELALPAPLAAQDTEAGLGGIVSQPGGGGRVGAPLPAGVALFPTHVCVAS